MAKFQLNTFYSFLFEETGQICLGFGWGSDAITADLNAQIQIAECYKTLLDDLSNPAKSWSSDTALWIDSCTLSSGAGTIVLESWDLVTATTDTILGGTTASGAGCW
mmetsp:Transcript_33391/g.51229  ORF Transcript_33391/g.51229 Transcript_33391/m.51229 type:complete len:107 (-) Transcript_33391:118-438(-)